MSSNTNILRRARLFAILTLVFLIFHPIFVTVTLAVPSGNLSISGRVYYSTHPLEGVRVELSQEHARSSLQTISTIDGYYCFSAVAPGSYDVCAYGPTSEYAYGTGYRCTVMSSNVTRDIDLPKLMSLRSPGKEVNITSMHPTLSWDANREACRYVVQINVVDGWQFVGFGYSTSTNYTVQYELIPGVRYTWQVGAFDASSHRVGTTHNEHYFTIVRPEHDLSVSIDTPGNAFPSTTIVNASVHNTGPSNESGIVVQFFVNGSLRASRTISYLQKGSSAKLGFPWPSVSMLGKYNLTLYIVPVIGEDSENNRVSNFVTICTSKTISCSVSPSEVSKGNVITVSGFISPTVTGQSITLTYRRPNGQIFSSTCTCNSDGSYTHSYQPDTAGTWSITVSCIDNPTQSSVSTSKSFTVKETTGPSATFPTTYIIESIAPYMIEVCFVAAMVTSIAVLIYVITKRREGPTTIGRL